MTVSDLNSATAASQSGSVELTRTIMKRRHICLKSGTINGVSTSGSHIAITDASAAPAGQCRSGLLTSGSDADERIYNCYVTVSPEGYVAKYRKLHAFVSPHLNTWCRTTAGTRIDAVAYAPSRPRRF